MSKLLEALENREFIDGFMTINGKNIPVKVRAFSSDDFKTEMKFFKESKDEKANADKLATYFYDSETLLPAFTSEQLLSKKIKNCDIRALFSLFQNCNHGLEGN